MGVESTSSNAQKPPGVQEYDEKVQEDLETESVETVTDLVSSVSATTLVPIVKTSNIPENISLAPVPKATKRKKKQKTQKTKPDVQATKKTNNTDVNKNTEKHKSVIDSNGGENTKNARTRVARSVQNSDAEDYKIHHQSNWNSLLPLQNFERNKHFVKRKKSGFNIAFLVQKDKKEFASKMLQRSKRNPWKFEIKGYWSDGSSSDSDESERDSESCSSESDDYSSYEPYHPGYLDKHYKHDFDQGISKVANNWMGIEAENEYFQEDFPPSRVQEHFLTEKEKRRKLSGQNDSIVKSNLTVYSGSVRMKMSQTSTLKNTTNILYLVLPSKYSVSDNSLVAITGNNTIVITQNMNDPPIVTGLRNQSNMLIDTSLQKSISTKLKAGISQAGLQKNNTGTFSLSQQKDKYKRKKRETRETTKPVGSLAKKINTQHIDKVLELAKSDNAEDHIPKEKKEKSEVLEYADGGMSRTKSVEVERNFSRSADYLKDGQWTESFDVINF